METKREESQVCPVIHSSLRHSTAVKLLARSRLRRVQRDPRGERATPTVASALLSRASTAPICPKSTENFQASSQLTTGQHVAERSPPLSWNILLTWLPRPLLSLLSSYLTGCIFSVSSSSRPPRLTALWPGSWPFSPPYSLPRCFLWLHDTKYHLYPVHSHIPSSGSHSALEFQTLVSNSALDTLTLTLTGLPNALCSKSRSPPTPEA